MGLLFCPTKDTIPKWRVVFLFPELMLMKRTGRRESCAARSQRRYAGIQQFNSMMESAHDKKHGVTIAPSEAIKAQADGRDPFEMARVANEALRVR